MVEGIPSRPRNKQSDETGKVDKGHFAVAFTHEDASRVIETESGRQFDPEVIAAFIEAKQDFRRISAT